MIMITLDLGIGVTNKLGELLQQLSLLSFLLFRSTIKEVTGAEDPVDDNDEFRRKQ